MNKYLHTHTSLIISLGVLDQQLVPSKTTQDKIVKQNTFVVHGDQRLRLLTKGKQTYENVNKLIE